MSDSEDFESSESEGESEEEELERDEAEDNGDFGEGSSDEAEFVDDEEFQDAQNEIQAQKVGRGSKARYPDLVFVEVQVPSDCPVFNPSFLPPPRRIPLQYFDDNFLLFRKIYGDDLLIDILDATNTQMRARFPSEVIFTIFYLI